MVTLVSGCQVECQACELCAAACALLGPDQVSAAQRGCGGCASCFTAVEPLLCACGLAWLGDAGHDADCWAALIQAGKEVVQHGLPGLAF